MPSVNIREIDNTGSETVSYLDYTVLVPGMHLKVPGEESGKFIPFEGLFTSVTDFEAHKGEFYDLDGDSCNPWEADPLGFFVAYHLVARGLSVQYVGAYKDGSESGDGAIVDSEGKSISADTFYKQFEDKGLYDLRFITVGGIKDSGADNAAIKCAGNRGDAVALLDVPQAYLSDESGSEVVKVKSAKDIDEYTQKFSTLANTSISRTGVSWSGTDTTTETYGRYAAIFAPFVNMRLSSYDDKSESKQVDIEMPASFDYLLCFAKQISNYAPWFATAGVVRGSSPVANIKPDIALGDAAIDLLQKRSADKEGHLATNAICEIKPYGQIIWGNRTLHPLSKPYNADANAAIQLTASSFLNIRQLCCTLKKIVYRASRKYTFEPNSDALWFAFCNAITPTLDKMTNNQGIRGYNIVRVPTNKKALMVARIIISPIEAVEDFDITIELSDSVEIAE